MNLPVLSAAQMASLTDGWTGAQKELFLSIPVISGLFPEVVEAHALVVRVDLTAQIAQAQAGISAQLSGLDPAHDSALRAIYRTLTAAADWCEAEPQPDPARAASLHLLRDSLLPDGLSWTRLSYSEEAGHALRVLHRLSPAQRELAGSVSLGRVSVLEMVERWAGIGTEMAQLLRTRANLEDPSDTDLSDARREWMRVITMVLGVLNGSRKLPPEARLLSQPIAEAVKAQEERLAQRGVGEAQGDAAATGEVEEGEGAGPAASGTLPGHGDDLTAPLDGAPPMNEAG